jgi:transcription elongation factor GreB
VSKAFTKESDDDAGDVTPHRARAPLPAGVSNYVTPRGLRLLREELAGLEAARDAAPDAGSRSGPLAARIAELAARVGSAVVLEAPSEPTDEVRFGALVVVRDDRGHERRLQIVGVDEADAAAGRIAFVSPFARALLGRRLGEIATVRTPKGEEEVELVSVTYDRDV